MTYYLDIIILFCYVIQTLNDILLLRDNKGKERELFKIDPKNLN